MCGLTPYLQYFSYMVVSYQFYCLGKHCYPNNKPAPTTDKLDHIRLYWVHLFTSLVAIGADSIGRLQIHLPYDRSHVNEWVVVVYRYILIARRLYPLCIKPKRCAWFFVMAHRNKTLPEHIFLLRTSWSLILLFNGACSREREQILVLQSYVWPDQV